MKNKFYQYYKPTDEEFDDLWGSAIISLDTNMLFNLYRYSEKTRSKILSLLTELKPRLWIPYQVALEFHHGRLKVITGEKKVYGDFLKDLNTLEGSLKNVRSPFISEKLSKEFYEIVLKIKGELDSKVNSIQHQLLDDGNLNIISNLFDGKVGDEFTENEYKQIYKEGESRFENDVPPGYKDKKKPAPDKFGDLIIWKGLIKKAKSDKKPVIFITGDQKEDWWWTVGGKTIGPRPELLAEMRQEANQSCYLYQPFRFLEEANKRLNKNIDEEVIGEVEELSNVEDKSQNTIIICIYIGFEKKEDLFNYISYLKKLGYQLELQRLNVDIKVALLEVCIPNIPDIERRFREKYLPLLDKHNLRLQDIYTQP